MNIKILYDNTAKTGFLSGWGFSALVDNSTLFDMGENAESLLANMCAFGVAPEQIKRVVLSHEDWDHVGGMSLLSQFGDVQVYVPSSFSKSIKSEIRSFNPDADIVQIKNALEVEPNLVVTEELGIVREESSLAVRSSQGVVLIVGCSHPGLDKIMSRVVSEYGPIRAVVGGFHGFRKLKALVDVPIIVPTHCTKKAKDIVKLYPEQARLVSAGTELELEE